MSARGAVILEGIEGGAGRVPMPLPVAREYSLAELLPRRSENGGYKVPGEIGGRLATALEGTLALLERPYRRLTARVPSTLLTPRWLRVLNHLVEHGFANKLVLSLPLEDGLPLYYFDLAASFLEHRTDGGMPNNLRYSRGFSEDYDHALTKVVGECLERGTLLYLRMADLVRGSARSLRARGMHFVDPARLGVFSPGQIARRPELAFDDDSIFGWAPVRSLVTDEEALVPAQLVYWNYPLGFGDVPEPLLREQNTNGGGGHFSIEGAVLSGLLECVQRDGFFSRWFSRQAPPVIDPSGIRRPATVRLVEAARERGLSPVFFDITSKLGIPTCLAALFRSDGGLPYVTIGGCCRVDGETALHDALLEAGSVHHVVAQSTERVRLADDYVPFSDPAFYTPRRLGFWANPEHAPHLAFFLGGPATSVREFCRGVPAGEDASASLARVVDVLRRHGMDAYFFEVRHAALDELGYATARVIVPDLVPMYCEDRNAPLGHSRVRSIADPPAWPHPFP